MADTNSLPPSADDKKTRRGKRKFLIRLGIAALAAWLGWYAWEHRPIHVDISMDGPTADWRHYGNDRGGSRYSPLTQINRENVQYLQVAWEYHTGDVSDGKGDAVESATAFEATPILVRETLYVPTPFNRIIALDPETGAERWAYDPHIDLSGDYANQLICRGVDYWESPEGEGRLLMGTNDGRLVAIDADSGKPCPKFGEAGQVDLKSGSGEERWLGEYQVTSPPVVAGDVAVVGSAVGDNARVDAPSGVVRGYDVRTGELVWAWDLRPPDYEPPEEMLSQDGYMLGTPNVWAPMAVDEQRGLVFIPTGNPAPDYYGGNRDGADHFGSSVVALNAQTGEVVWHFQTVHHDLWDYDVPAQPTLVDIEYDGKTIPAVVQATKMGFLFCLNRETGEPIYGVEERPVPQSTVPGEQTSPTQPFPIKPPQLVPDDLKSEDGWGPLGIRADECKQLLASMYFDGMYTPPQLEKLTLMYPGNAGGSNWGGVAADAERQIVIANVMDVPFATALIKRENLDAWREDYPDEEFGGQEGTPYAMLRMRVLSSLDLPCNPPPWGTLAAVDLTAGELLWQVPFGTIQDLAPAAVPNIKYGVPNLGGPIVTGSGVVFIAAAMDNYLRAYDIETGNELWKGRLPAGGQATPMTYRLRPDSKQYVVIAAGGHARAGTKLGDSVVAFALPE